MSHRPGNSRPREKSTGGAADKDSAGKKDTDALDDQEAEQRMRSVVTVCGYDLGTLQSELSLWHRAVREIPVDAAHDAVDTYLSACVELTHFVGCIRERQMSDMVRHPEALPAFNQPIEPLLFQSSSSGGAGVHTSPAAVDGSQDAGPSSNEDGNSPAPSVAPQKSGFRRDFAPRENIPYAFLLHERWCEMLTRRWIEGQLFADEVTAATPLANTDDASESGTQQNTTHARKALQWDQRMKRLYTELRALAVLAVQEASPLVRPIRARAKGTSEATGETDANMFETTVGATSDTSGDRGLSPTTVLGFQRPHLKLELTTMDGSTLHSSVSGAVERRFYLGDGRPKLSTSTTDPSSSSSPLQLMNDCPTSYAGSLGGSGTKALGRVAQETYISAEGFIVQHWHSKAAARCFVNNMETVKHRPMEGLPVYAPYSTCVRLNGLFFTATLALPVVSLPRPRRRLGDSASAVPVDPLGGTRGTADGKSESSGRAPLGRTSSSGSMSGKSRTQLSQKTEKPKGGSSGGSRVPASNEEKDQDEQLLREAVAPVFDSNSAIKNTMLAPETLYFIGADGRPYLIDTVCSFVDQLAFGTAPSAEMMKWIRKIARKVDELAEGAGSGGGSGFFSSSPSASNTSHSDMLRQWMHEFLVPIRFLGAVFQETTAERSRSIVLEEMALRGMGDLWTLLNCLDFSGAFTPGKPENVMNELLTKCRRYREIWAEVILPHVTEKFNIRGIQLSESSLFDFKKASFLASTRFGVVITRTGETKLNVVDPSEQVIKRTLPVFSTPSPTTMTAAPSTTSKTAGSFARAGNSSSGKALTPPSTSVTVPKVWTQWAVNALRYWSRFTIELQGKDKQGNALPLDFVNTHPWPCHIARGGDATDPTPSSFRWIFSFFRTLAKIFLIRDQQCDDYILDERGVKQFQLAFNTPTAPLTAAVVRYPLTLKYSQAWNSRASALAAALLTAGFVKSWNVFLKEDQVAGSASLDSGSADRTTALQLGWVTPNLVHLVLDLQLFLRRQPASTTDSAGKQLSAKPPQRRVPNLKEWNTMSSTLNPLLNALLEWVSHSHRLSSTNLIHQRRVAAPSASPQDGTTSNTIWFTGLKEREPNEERSWRTFLRQRYLFGLAAADQFQTAGSALEDICNSIEEKLETAMEDYEDQIQSPEGGEGGEDGGASPSGGASSPNKSQAKRKQSVAKPNGRQPLVGRSRISSNDVTRLHPLHTSAADSLCAYTAWFYLYSVLCPLSERDGFVASGGVERVEWCLPLLEARGSVNKPKLAETIVSYIDIIRCFLRGKRKTDASDKLNDGFEYAKQYHGPTFAFNQLRQVIDSELHQAPEVLIQRCYREYKARQRKNEIEIPSAMMIQRMSRAGTIRQKLYRRLMIVRLQRIGRGMMSRKTSFELSQLQNIQRIGRGLLARKELVWKYILRWQLAGRGYLARVAVRRWQLKVLHALTVLQPIARGLQSRQGTYARWFAKNHAASCVTRVFKGYILRKKFSKLWGATTICRLSRSYLERKRLGFVRETVHTAAKILQFVGRGYTSRVRITPDAMRLRRERRLAATLFIQRVGWGFLDRTLLQSRRYVIHRSRCTRYLKAVLRGMFERIQLARAKAAKLRLQKLELIQRCGRGFSCRKVAGVVHLTIPRRRLHKAICQATAFHLDQMVELIRTRRADTTRTLHYHRKHLLELRYEASLQASQDLLAPTVQNAPLASKLTPLGKELTKREPQSKEEEES